MCCTPLLISILSVTSPYCGLAFVVSFCRVDAVLLPFVFVVCVSLRVVPGGICVFLLSLASRARSPFLFFVLFSFLVRFSVFPCCLFSLVVFPVSFLLASPAPRIVSCVLWFGLHSCVLVPPSEYLVAAVTAPLPCFLLGVWSCFVFPPPFGSWQQRLLPCVGFFTLYTMLLVTSGSLVRPYRGIHRYDDPDPS